MLKKAMIMAAGVGSRLGPLSNIVPKPLVPLANIPAMDILVRHISSFGIKDIIANTYYKSEDIQKHYKETDFGVNFRFLQETELSGTAGGVRKCRFFFDEGQDFIVMSGDGLTDIDINKAYESHQKSNAIATIIVKQVESKDIPMYGIIVPDKNGFVESFQEKPPIREAKSDLANTGIYIFKYEIFNFIPENTFYDFAKNVFPSLMDKGIKINTYIHNGYWSDIGSIEQYKLSNSDILNNMADIIPIEIIRTEKGKCVCGSSLVSEFPVNIEGDCIIGNNCKLGKNCTIKNSILWDNVEVRDNIIIEDSIVLPDITVTESIYNQIISEENKVSV